MGILPISRRVIPRITKRIPIPPFARPVLPYHQTKAARSAHGQDAHATFFLRVITVSLETNRIVAGLPGLEIEISE